MGISQERASELGKIIECQDFVALELGFGFTPFPRAHEDGSHSGTRGRFEVALGITHDETLRRRNAGTFDSLVYQTRLGLATGAPILGRMWTKQYGVERSGAIGRFRQHAIMNRCQLRQAHQSTANAGLVSRDRETHSRPAQQGQGLEGAREPDEIRRLAHITRIGRLVIQHPVAVENEVPVCHDVMSRRDQR